ncbi:MAG: TolC family protein [Bdellovibrionales bacterium]|nr:TolC family protein [Bdellovibrionales bacterium]
MKEKNFRLAILLLFFTATSALGASSLEVKPDDLPKLLSDRNQNVRGSALMVDAAEAKTGHLARSYLPTLNFEVGGETFQTGSYPTKTEPYGLLEAKLNLFRGGKDLLEERINRAQVRLADAQSKQVTSAELVNTRKLYWTLVFQREEILILKDALEQNEKNLNAANRRIQRGLTSDTDRLDFEINRDQLKEDIKSLEHEAELTQIKLRALLALSEDVEIKTLAVIPHDHDEELLKTKFQGEGNFHVETVKASGEVSENQSARENRWWTPTLDLYAGYYLYTLRDRDYLSIGQRDDRVAGIRLTFQLFDGFQAKSIASSYSIQAQAYENQAIQKRRDTEADFTLAKEEMQHMHELIHQAEKRIEQGKLYLSKTLSEYDRGVKNSPDVLGAILRQNQFRRRYAEIRKNYVFSKAELLSILGK